MTARVIDLAAHLPKPAEDGASDEGEPRPCRPCDQWDWVIEGPSVLRVAGLTVEGHAALRLVSDPERGWQLVIAGEVRDLILRGCDEREHRFLDRLVATAAEVLA